MDSRQNGGGGETKRECQPGDSPLGRGTGNLLSHLGYPCCHRADGVGLHACRRKSRVRRKPASARVACAASGRERSLAPRPPQSRQRKRTAAPRQEPAAMRNPRTSLVRTLVRSFRLAYCPKAYWASRVNGSGYNPAASVTNTATPRATACALVMTARGASPGCWSQACTTMRK